MEIQSVNIKPKTVNIQWNHALRIIAVLYIKLCIVNVSFIRKTNLDIAPVVAKHYLSQQMWNEL